MVFWGVYIKRGAVSLPVKVFLVNLFFFAAWYFIGAVVLRWWFSAKSGSDRFHPRKIFPENVSKRQLRRESGYSAVTVLLLGLSWMVVWTMDRLRWNQFYWDITEHSILWLVSSIALTVLLWDAWFYWTHRLMHTKLLFRVFHRTHHRSRITNAMTGYSLDIPEALVYVVFLPLVALLYPMHPVSMMAFMVINLAGNFVIHSGHEFMPAGFGRTRWCRWLNTSTAHAMHHHDNAGNYGYFLMFWDRVMGTCHPDYDARMLARCENQHSDPQNEFIVESTGLLGDNSKV